MGTIQTSIRNDRGEIEQLDHNDARYWNGPHVHYHYPKALYRQAQPGAECEHRIVRSDSERNALGSDWHESPADAKAYFEKLEADMATAAAEHSAAVARMSEKAQREADAYARSTDEMTADVPAPRRGRPRKDETPQ